MRILFVDPHDGVRHTFKRLFKLKGGHQIMAFPALCDAEERLERGEHFDLLITCIKVADCDTWDVMPDFKARFPGLKVIAHTGYGTEAEIERIIAAGFDAYVLKPSSHELFDAVERFFPGSMQEAPAPASAV